MSCVANIVLFTFLDEAPSVGGINRWLGEQNESPLVEVADLAGGSRAFQGDLWIGAFNYLDIPAFIAIVFAQDWRYPESVAVAVQDEHEEWPTLHRTYPSTPEPDA